MRATRRRRHRRRLHDSDECRRYRRRPYDSDALVARKTGSYSGRGRLVVAGDADGALLRPAFAWPLAFHRTKPRPCPSRRTSCPGGVAQAGQGWPALARRSHGRRSRAMRQTPRARRPPPKPTLLASGPTGTAAPTEAGALVLQARQVRRLLPKPMLVLQACQARRLPQKPTLALKPQERSNSIRSRRSCVSSQTGKPTPAGDDPAIRHVLAAAVAGRRHCR